MASNFGSVGKVWVDVGADLSKLSQQMAQAVPQAQASGVQIGKAISSGVNTGAESFEQFRARINGMASDAARAGQQMQASLGASAQAVAGHLKTVSSNALAVGTALSVGVTAPLVALAAGAIDAFGKIDSLQRGLVAVDGSARGAAEQFAALREVARLPGLGLEEAVQGSVRLQAFGFSASGAKEALLAFGNAIATVGGGKAELDRVIIQLGQMAGAGKVLNQDLRPIIQTVPQVAEIIRREFGPEALGAPAETLAALGVSSQQFIDVLVTELGKLPQVTGGIKNDLENFSDSVKINLAKVGEAMAPLVHFAVETFVPAMEAAVAVFGAMPAPMQGLVVIFGGLVAAVGPAVLVFGGLARGLSEIITFLNTARVATMAHTVAVEANTLANLANSGSAGGVVGALKNMLPAASGSAGAVGLLGKAFAGLGLVAAASSLVEVIGKMNEAEASVKEMEDELIRAGKETRRWAEDTESHAKNVALSLRNLKESIGGNPSGDGGFFEWLFGKPTNRQDQVIENLKQKLDLLHITVDRGKMTFREYVDAMGSALDQVGKIGVQYSETTKGIIADQKALEAKYAEAKESVEQLTAAMRAGDPVAGALRLANENLKSAYEALHPNIQTTKEKTEAANEANRVMVQNIEMSRNAMLGYAGGMIATEAELAEMKAKTDEANKAHGGMLTTMENGVKVIRGNADELREAATAVGGYGSAASAARVAHEGFTKTLENNVTVIRGTGSAIKEAAGETQRAGMIFGEAITWAQYYGKVGAAASGASEAIKRTASATGVIIGEARRWNETSGPAAAGFVHVGDSADGARVKIERAGDSLRQFTNDMRQFTMDAASWSMDEALGDSPVFGAGKIGGGGSVFSGGYNPDPFSAKPGDVKSFTNPGGVDIKTGTGMAAFGSLVVELWTAEELALFQKAIDKINAQKAANTAAGAAAAIAAAEFKKEQEAQELVAKAANGMVPTYEQLAHQFDLLIDAGMGNTAQARELFTQLQMMDTAYGDSAASAGSASAAVRKTSGAFFELAQVAVAGVNTISAAVNKTKSWRSGTALTEPIAPLPIPTSPAIGSRAPMAAPDAPAGRFYPVDTAAYAASVNAQMAAAQAAATPSGPQGYFTVDPLQGGYTAPSYTPTDAPSVPSYQGTGIAPVWIAIPPGSAESIGQAVTRILEERAGY